MKLTSMKMDREAMKEQASPADVAPDMPVYPWGLTVRLDEDSLDKLAIEKLPEVGGERMLIAKVRVVSVSSNEHDAPKGKGKHKHRNVELQITEMAIDDVPAEKDAGDTLYAKG